MKMLSGCFDCENAEPFPLNLGDDGILTGQCPHGHKQVTIVQALRFEILFDFGTLALRDGYFREAVTSFAAALERSFELYIKTVVSGDDRSKDKLREAWKLIGHQSERQLGAFSVLYLVQTGQAWTHLPDGLAKLRNDCVHKGYQPTRAETESYGEKALDAIWRVIDGLGLDKPSDLLRLAPELSERHNKAQELYQKDGLVRENRPSPSLVADPTVVHLSWDGRREPPRDRFRQLLASEPNWLTKMYPRDQHRP